MSYKDGWITSDIPGWIDLKPFQAWCVQVLPTIFDDTMTYYEVLCKLRKIMADCITDIGLLEKEFDNIPDDIKEFSKMMQEIKDTLSTLSDSLNTLTDKVSTINADVDTIKSEISTLNSDIEDLSGQINANRLKVNDLLERVSTIETAFPQLEEQVNTNTADITELKARGGETKTKYLFFAEDGISTQYFIVYIFQALGGHPSLTDYIKIYNPDAVTEPRPTLVPDTITPIIQKLVSDGWLTNEFELKMVFILNDQATKGTDQLKTSFDSILGAVVSSKTEVSIFYLCGSNETLPTYEYGYMNKINVTILDKIRQLKTSGSYNTDFYKRLYSIVTNYLLYGHAEYLQKYSLSVNDTEVGYCLATLAGFTLNINIQDYRASINLFSNFTIPTSTLLINAVDGILAQLEVWRTTNEVAFIGTTRIVISQNGITVTRPTNSTITQMTYTIKLHANYFVPVDSM